MKNLQIILLLFVIKTYYYKIYKYFVNFYYEIYFELKSFSCKTYKAPSSDNNKIYTYLF